ncbi:5'-nucleotidase [Holothuria leucospilota]|uniref:5'-nucleotidase n=1 Tax=Holothuria leucospilota TaxID=206669 RepID=A0A9Q0YNK3_HOLLE|nr:5'-nucleotidase [Holothuria leucospilota]
MGPCTLSVMILLLTLSPSLSYDLTIMHTNDVHARFEQFNKYGSDCSEEDEANGACFGGVARRVTKINEIRDSYENTLLLDAGDEFQGTQWFYYYQGRATSYFMNHMGYDAMALGNHEFDNGVEGLFDFLYNVTFPILSSNIDASGEPELEGMFEKSVVIDVGGERIGIVGYIYSRTPEISKPGKNLVFLDEIPSVQAEVDALVADGVNKIIALGHAGYGTDIDIAKNTVGIDIIVGGHSNSFLYTGTPPTDDVAIGPYPTVVTPENAPEDQVLIVQDYTFAKYLGFLQVTFDDDGKITEYGGNPITLDSAIEEDPATLAEINEFAIPVKEYTENVIGETYVFLNGETPICRTVECNMGNVVTDAMLEDLVAYQNEDSWSDVAISIMNGGGIRASIAQACT